MAQTGNFKSYERGNRYQTTHSAFSAGMHFTDAPIPEGAAKVLVNYDVGEDGMSLRPRKSLSANKVAVARNTVERPIEYIDSKYCASTDKLQVVCCEQKTDGWSLHVYTYNSNGTFIGEYETKTANKAETYRHVGCFVGDQYFTFNKEGVLCYTDYFNNRYGVYSLSAQQTTYAQAQQMGFNMLLQNPYTYTDTYVAGATTAMNFQSINAFDDAACTIPAQQELLLNKQYYYRVSYSGAGEVKLVFDWTAADTMEWQELTTIEKFTVGKETPTKIKIPFSSPVSKAIIRCTAYSGETPLDIIWFSFDYKEQYTKAEVPLNNFSLHTATTMAYWQNRLVVAGVSEDPAYLFMSAPELFEYFPFPHNADYLDEPIVHLQPLLDNLLVFTKSKLYLYTLDPTNGLTRKCIQTNLNITETQYIQTVKNMVFFKSGIYFYMVVPKLNSTTGELTIAPVYRNIKGLLDNFAIERTNIINEVYPELNFNPESYEMYNYLDFESIHNVYAYKIEENLYINFDLMYNTVKRFWSIYLYSSPGLLHVFQSDATQPGTLFCITHDISKQNTDFGAEQTLYTPRLQKFVWGEPSLKDTFFTSDNVKVATPYNNVQYLDTGNIDINSNYKKRFREVQFRIVNNAYESLDFNTEIYVDGVATVPKYDYVPIIDESAGTLTLTKTLLSTPVDNLHIQGTTNLGHWHLSEDAFPSAKTIKVRVPTSGKGYNSQIKIRCNSQQDYTLLDITNVYRLLYSR